MREADGAYGHQLQQSKEKMARLKKDGKANVKMARLKKDGKANVAILSADKRALAVEVKAVVEESKEVMHVAKTAHK